MASVYRNAESVAARESRPAVREKADQLAARARRRLAQHRHAGDAEITVTHGRTDSFVNLEDPGGGALAIEYGRGPNSEGRGATQGIYPLHYAIGAAPDE